MEPSDRVRDAELVARWKAGDDLAFRELYDAWFDRCYDLARRYVDADAAADVVHDAFISAVGHRNELRDEASFGGWLLRITRNRAIDRTRRERRTISVAEPELIGSSDAEERARTIADPEQVALDADLAALVWDSVGALGERDADVITLHVRQGLEPAEIAEVLGVNRVHAAQLLHRSRERLGDAIRARVLWRAGDPSCDALRDELRTGGFQRFDATTARGIVRHAKLCDVCQERQRTALAPAALFAALPIVVPAGLRERLWVELASATTAGTAGTAAGTASHATRSAGTRAAGRTLPAKVAGGLIAVSAVAAVGAVFATRRDDTPPPTTTLAASESLPTITTVGAGTVTTTGAPTTTDPLVIAVTDRDDATIRSLLEGGADPDTVDADGDPVLYLAAVYGFDGIVGTLLDAGAHIDAANGSGERPVHAAAEQGRLAVLDVLVARGTDLEALDDAGRRPLDRSVLGNQAAAVARLIAAGADPQGDDPTTPLHLAATLGLGDVVDALLEGGADPRARDAAGATPSDLARARGDEVLAARIDAAA